jgi:predicted transcriptional regulator
LVSDCEKIIKATLPSIKIAVAKALARDNIKQERIAACLGISQAAVNKYIKGKYSATLKEIVTQIKDSPEIDELAHSVETGKGARYISKKIDLFASKRIRFAITSLK